MLALLLSPSIEMHPRNRAGEGAVLVMSLVLAGIGFAIGLAIKLGRDASNDPFAP